MKVLCFFIVELLLESNSGTSFHRGPRLFNQFMQQASTTILFITGWARNVNFFCTTYSYVMLGL